VRGETIAVLGLTFESVVNALHVNRTVPVLAKGKTRTGRTYVRDDRPFAGTAAPAAAFFYSADRQRSTRSNAVSHALSS
jgi:hypothetical protein